MPGEMDLTDGGAIDLTTREKKVGRKKIKFKEKDYDPKRQEDTARRRIAYILLALLGIVILWSLASITFCPDSEDKIVNILQIVLGPMVALVSAATGFYFGSKSK